MSISDASTLVGESLITVISEHVNEPSEPSGTPALFTPPEPSPPLASENLMDGSGDRPPELPDALLRLQNSGHHMQVISCSAWNVRGNQVRVKKELSVCFSVDTVITSHEVIVGFDEAGIDIEDIRSVQRRASNNSWVVTFGSKAVKDAALNEQSITIAGCSVLLGDCENKVSIVKIYELPNELPDSVVIGRLSHYGRVISFRRDRVADAIFNGVRTARMCIERPIPSQAFIAGEFCRFWYPSQPKTCRKCGAEDHLAAACRSQRCFNCEQPGHRAEQCDQPALCRVCLSDGHETTNCPFIYYSSNITGAKPQEKSYSGAAHSGKVADEARKAEEASNRAKREEEERARSEERARREKEKEQERKEKERKDRERKERKEREQRDRDRKEKEREDREREDRRDRDRRKHDKERRYKDDDGYRRDERNDRERDHDRYRSSRDRSSHRDRESNDSESDNDGWTRVSYRREKGKSKSY